MNYEFREFYACVDDLDDNGDVKKIRMRVSVNRSAIASAMPNGELKTVLNMKIGQQLIVEGAYEAVADWLFGGTVSIRLG